MTTRIRNITVDCADPYRLAGFWSAATGYVEDPQDPNTAGGDEAFLSVPGTSLGLLFIAVPEGKTGKNRLHLDLAPTDRTRDEEVARLEQIGATVVADHRTADGKGWVTMADPEGNEFCVERSDAERAGS
ncbi:VOC family protein [Nakamurella silvestris]|nr:VOC family protein [Nakamurella silvestris]